MNFWKTLLASLIGSFLAAIVFTLLSFAIFAGIIGSLTAEEEVTVPANSVLKLDLNYPIPERTNDDPLLAILSGNPDMADYIGLNAVLENIAKAKEDEDIKGIFIEMGVYPNGLATTEAIRNALKDFKESGKFVIAYGETVSQRAYYLGSVADEIYLNKAGYFEFRGFGSQLMFLKGTLDKLDIEVQVFHRGDYKSAFEPLVREEMSDSNRVQLTYVLDDIYGHFLNEISESRGIDTARLHDIANDMLASMPSKAVDMGLVDGATWYDKVLDNMKDKVGIGSDEELSMVSLSKYAETDGPSRSGDKIAVVYAQGSIVDGDGDSEQIGSVKYAKEIRKLRNDDDIKAIVLRVNSGGGSALASDVIWRELTLAKEQKPVIVSFGDVAASGGYYISCNADKIVAQPNTITGSIGVFGIIPNMEGFFNNKLGITFDEVETTKHGVFGGVSAPLNPEEQAIIQEGVDSIYVTFLTRVAEGRGLTFEYVEKYAGGRIWTGTQALEIGLVDEIGGLDRALEIAAEEAGLDEWKVREYPHQKTLVEEMMASFSAQSKSSFIENELGQTYTYYSTVKEMLEMSPIQARMPYLIEIY